MFDVIVAGAGLAGWCAARTAAGLGRSVLLLERDGPGGGNSALSAGSFAFAETDLQGKLGIADTPSRLLQDLLSAATGTGDRALIELYAREQRETYHWLVARGIRFSHVQASPYQTVPRSHVTGMREALSRLRAPDADGELEFRSPARLFAATYDPERLTVAVSFTDGASGIHQAACRALILCTGGFSHSRELLSRFAPSLVEGIGGAPSSLGDGLKVGLALRAGMADMQHLSATFGTAASTEFPHWIMHPIYEGAIAVNAMGERFADESRSYKELGSLCLAQPGARAFQVFDQTVMDRAEEASPVRDFRGALQRGLLFPAATLEELAARACFPPGALESTIRQYNADVQQGDDHAFGRRHLVGRLGRPIGLDSPPYYLYPCSARVVSTYAGLKLDTNMNVVDEDEAPIPWLFAAGDVTGGFHGRTYVSGTGLGKAAVFGRVAGRQASLLAR